MAEIRAASPADAGTLAAMRYDFRASATGAAEPREAFVSRCAAWMARELQDLAAGWRCWVAHEAGVVIGHVWLHRIAKIPNPGEEPEAHAYISNLYVAPPHRGRGTGGRLLGAALEWCAGQDVDAVILWPTAESRSLYERHGFRAADDLLELRSGGGRRRRI